MHWFTTVAIEGYYPSSVVLIASLTVAACRLFAAEMGGALGSRGDISHIVVTLVFDIVMIGCLAQQE